MMKWKIEFQKILFKIKPERKDWINNEKINIANNDGDYVCNWMQSK